jgi:hypothetical protein
MDGVPRPRRGGCGLKVAMACLGSLALAIVLLIVLPILDFLDNPTVATDVAEPWPDGVEVIDASDLGCAPGREHECWRLFVVVREGTDASALADELQATLGDRLETKYGVYVEPASAFHPSFDTPKVEGLRRAGAVVVTVTVWTSG